MEEALKEMIPELRSAITRNELSDIEYWYMFAAGEFSYHIISTSFWNCFTVQPANETKTDSDSNQEDSIRDCSVEPSYFSDGILDTTAVNQWLPARPAEMRQIPSPPIYDSAHPDHVLDDESELSSDDDLDELESENDSSDDGQGGEYNGYIGDQSD